MAGSRHRRDPDLLGHLVRAVVLRAFGSPEQLVLEEVPDPVAGPGQVARNAGARVVAAAGGERKISVADQLGATVAVDYSRSGWSGHVRGRVGAVDVVFDGVGGDVGREAFGLLRAGGRCVLYGMSS